MVTGGIGDPANAPRRTSLARSCPIAASRF
jgi:hypothetical protein